MIAVERIESAASAQDVDALLASLEGRPGLWMGCDVVSEGLYRKESIACAVPAVRFCLDGAMLSATALTPAGGGLLAAFGPRDGRCGSGAEVVAEFQDRAGAEHQLEAEIAVRFFQRRGRGLAERGARRQGFG